MSVFVKGLVSAGLTFFMAAAFAAQVEVLWLGHGTVRITSTNGKVILVDPFIKQNPKVPAKFKDLKALGKVDVILVTHGHSDHVADLEELATLTGATVVANYELIRQYVEMGMLEAGKIVAMNKGGTVKPLGRGIQIHMVPAEHSSSLDLVVAGSPDLGINKLRHLDAGAPVGYVVELENGFRIYLSGDTDVFGDMALIHQFFKPDLAMICIGGHFTMGPERAAFAVRELLKPKQVIPIHYGTYPVINRTPAEFKAALGDAPVELLVLEPGKAVMF
jgi:L-ascorbate metabolism protein UlaG (beta-lactamase superfamily)